MLLASLIGTTIAMILFARRNGIPLDMLGLEPGWMSNAYPCSFEWDGKRFPDPKAFLDEVEKQHVRVNLWFNPYVSPTAPLYQKLLPFAEASPGATGLELLLPLALKWAEDIGGHHGPGDALFKALARVTSVDIAGTTLRVARGRQTIDVEPVVGAVVGEPVVVNATADSGLDVRLDAAGDRLSLSHGLVRQTLYDSLQAPGRAVLHRATAYDTVNRRRLMQRTTISNPAVLETPAYREIETRRSV